MRYSIRTMRNAAGLCSSGSSATSATAPDGREVGPDVTDIGATQTLESVLLQKGKK